jgi:hypothetical protein
MTASAIPCPQGLGGIIPGGGNPRGAKPGGIPMGGGGMPPIGGIPGAARHRTRGEGGGGRGAGGNEHRHTCKSMPQRRHSRMPPIGRGGKAGIGPPTPLTGPASPGTGPDAAMPLPAARAAPGPPANADGLLLFGRLSIWRDTTFTPRSNTSPNTLFSSRSSTARDERGARVHGMQARQGTASPYRRWLNEL